MSNLTGSSLQPLDADGQLERFELAWRVGKAITVRQFVDSLQAPVPTALLIELVLLDMDYRWRTEGAARSNEPSGYRPTWHDYAVQLPELDALREVPAWAIAEQYRLTREMRGDVCQEQFVAGYAEHALRLGPLLERIDDEVRVECRSASSHTACSAPPTDDPRASLTHHDFVLQAHLGSGGMGKVYRAWQKSLERPVAIKALLKRRLTDPVAVEHFVQEARVLAMLRHPGIVGVQGLGRFPDGGYFIAMDLVDGEDLAQRLAKAPLATAEALRIALRVAQAMEFAHREGVLHCDLKPSNVLLDRDDRVLVSDFGLARLLAPRTDDRPLHSLGGTPAFMAPEQFDPEHGVIGPATDVFGVGGILFAALTGKSPRRAGGLVVRESLPGVPRALGALCMRCLSAAPSGRPQSMAELEAALHEVARNELGGAIH